jgi:hypothetical protein
MTPDPRARLDRAALRATAADPARVGHWLDRHKATEDLTDDALAAKLKTDGRGLALLALCETPRPATFADDVRAVAAVAGAEPAALANLLRQEQGLAAWAAKPGEAAPSETGWLIAAHDADQPPPGDADDPRGG